MSEMSEQATPSVTKPSKIAELTKAGDYLNKTSYDPFKGKSATMDGRTSSNYNLYSYQELMAKKGSKCICVENSKKKCGSFCRK